MPQYNEPKNPLTPVVLSSSAPTKLFPVRSEGVTGWQCHNGTGQTMTCIEVKSGEVPTLSQVLAAGEPVADGESVEGDSRTADVYAVLASGSGTVYPQEKM